MGWARAASASDAVIAPLSTIACNTVSARSLAPQKLRVERAGMERGPVQPASPPLRATDFCTLAEIPLRGRIRSIGTRPEKCCIKVTEQDRLC